MSIIKVETPEGIIKVEIDGEEPTQEELIAIDRQFFKKTERPFDIGKASIE